MGMKITKEVRVYGLLLVCIITMVLFYSKAYVNIETDLPSFASHKKLIAKEKAVLHLDSIQIYLNNNRPDKALLQCLIVKDYEGDLDTVSWERYRVQHELAKAFRALGLNRESISNFEKCYLYSKNSA